MKPSLVSYLVKHGNRKTLDYTAFDINDINEQGNNALQYVLANNKSCNLNLTDEQMNYLINNSNLMQHDIGGWSILMSALAFNKEEHLNLSSEQLDYLINNCNLKQVNEQGANAAILALKYFVWENLKLKKEQLDYLIKNCCVSDIYYEDSNILTSMLALDSYQKKDKILNKEQFKWVIKKMKLTDKSNSLLLETTLKFFLLNNAPSPIYFSSLPYFWSFFNKKEKLYLINYINNSSLKALKQCSDILLFEEKENINDKLNTVVQKTNKSIHKI